MRALSASILIASLIIGGAILYVGGAFEDFLQPEWKPIVADRLRNPETAQFKNVRIDKMTGWVCGEISGENAFGARNGWIEFMAQPPSNLKGFERTNWKVTLESDYAAVIGMCR